METIQVDICPSKLFGHFNFDDTNECNTFNCNSNWQYRYQYICVLVFKWYQYL